MTDRESRRVQTAALQKALRQSLALHEVSPKKAHSIASYALLLLDVDGWHLQPDDDADVPTVAPARKSRRDPAALTVRCPTCDVYTGERCQRPSGQETGEPHAARKQAAWWRQQKQETAPALFDVNEPGDHVDPKACEPITSDHLSQ